jgi:hypothetical protein
MVGTKNSGGTAKGWIKRKLLYGLTGSKNRELTIKKHKERIPWNKGKKGRCVVHSDLEERRKRMVLIGKSNLGKTGEKAHQWKGDDVGYFALHQWVYKNKGKPKECSFCKTKEGKIQWANVSWEYKRDLNDFMPLCVECHRGYDSNFRRQKIAI